MMNIIVEHIKLKDGTIVNLPFPVDMKGVSSVDDALVFIIRKLCGYIEEKKDAIVLGEDLVKEARR